MLLSVLFLFLKTGMLIFPFKVAGNTIYNMIKMEDCEVDGDDRPLFPPKIKKAEVKSRSVIVSHFFKKLYIIFI